MSLNGAKPPRRRIGRSTQRDSDGLTPNQRRFCLEYVQDLNASAAARRAGYSPTSAMAKGQALMALPSVRRVIDGILSQVERKYTLDAASILKELARVAMSDPRRLFDDEGNVKPINTWSADDAACIAQVDIVKRNVYAGDGKMDEILKIRLWDKPKTLEILAKHLGLLTERLEIRGDAELVEKLAGARRRLAIAVQSE